MDPATIAIGATLLSGVTSVMQGTAEATAANYERAALEDQKKLAEIEALNEEADRRQRLSRALSAQAAQAAALGFDASRSRSFAAIQRADTRTAMREIDQIRLMGAMGQRQYSLASKSLKRSARGSLIGGYLNLAGSAAKAYGQWGDLGKGDAG